MGLAALIKRFLVRSLLPALCLAWVCASTSTGSIAWAESPAALCPRPAPGGSVPEPEDLRSIDGVLDVALSITDERAADGSIRYCYRTPGGQEAPTLRVRPGDLVRL